MAIGPNKGRNVSEVRLKGNIWTALSHLCNSREEAFFVYIHSCINCVILHYDAVHSYAVIPFDFFNS